MSASIELSTLLFHVLRSPMTAEAPEGHYCGDYTFTDPDGWEVTIFYDCGKWDYIASVKAPDGRKATYPFDEYQTAHGNPMCWDWQWFRSVPAPSPQLPPDGGK